ncbi:hypothetical protein BDP27DRAFT_1034758 [Rhodocollybia butyracea]|uniref:Uncharacterized protein n=1 Tax=Rhodocollybia butyracea TaxID=206335 RepID=A0A9P5UCT1_9AGAR|nr:hypothetical protein BDP27DRAFT_1034758 [Rhodocollybia butyracea]
MSASDEVSTTGNTLSLYGQSNHSVQGTESYRRPNISASGPNGTRPSVLSGAGKFTVSNTTIRAGAMSAVGGRQIIRSRGPEPARYNEQVSTDNFTHGTSDPTVLARFDGEISNATCGLGSFTAVGGKQNFRSRRRPTDATRSARHPNVLPDRSDIPPPNNGRFDDGQYAAIAGNSGSIRVSPNVLSDFRNVHAHHLDLLPGSFCAVSEDQDIEYDVDDQQQ